MTKTNRRGFLRNALGVMATTPALAAEPGVLRMQTVTSGVRSSGRYDDSMIFERKRFTWPAGKTLALWVIPNVEVWSFDSAADAALSPNGAIGSPDVIN